LKLQLKKIVGVFIFIFDNDSIISNKRKNIMKQKRFFLATCFLVIVNVLFAQQSKINWDKWNFLMAEWVGEGYGLPGQGSGSFTFQTDLDGKILVRKNHTEFPATLEKAASVHKDLLSPLQPAHSPQIASD